jgi:hypothetical protein
MAFQAQRLHEPHDLKHFRIQSILRRMSSLGLEALKEQFIIAKQRIASEIGAVQTCSSALAMNQT